MYRRLRIWKDFATAFLMVLGLCTEICREDLSLALNCPMWQLVFYQIQTVSVFLKEDHRTKYLQKTDNIALIMIQNFCLKQCGMWWIFNQIQGKLCLSVQHDSCCVCIFLSVFTSEINKEKGPMRHAKHRCAYFEKINHRAYTEYVYTFTLLFYVGLHLPFQSNSPPQIQQGWCF